MTIRQDIMTNIMTRMATIMTANGYTSNIGARCYEWRDIAIDESLIPCLVVTDEKCEQREDGETEHSWALTVKIGILVKGTTASAQVRAAIGDVAAAIGTDLTWSGKADNTVYMGDSMEMDHQSVKFGITEITIEVHYHTDAWDHSNLTY